MLFVEIVETPELGDRSYVVHDGKVAVVIDPQRDLDRIRGQLDRLGVDLQLVCETHIHNDYLTGGLALARSAGVPYLVAAGDPVDFERLAVEDGDVQPVGLMSLRAVATPGHTPTHLSYVVTVPGCRPAVFTGGSLLFGGVGRTDLVSPEQTEPLARSQYRSVRRLVETLSGEAGVFPTHGFGSFCAATPSTGQDTTSSVAIERQRNAALTEPDEDHFTKRLVAGFPPYPSYYAHMAPQNLLGFGEADLSSPALIDEAELGERVAAGACVIDLRPRTSYAADHLTGTIAIELTPMFSTYVGWLIPYGEPLTLIADDATRLAAAQRQLARIGFDRPSGFIVADTRSLTGISGHGSYPVARFSDLPAAAGERALDVRRADEQHDVTVRDAINVPLHELSEAIPSLPAGRLWVHCASGFRAGIATSLLSAAGRDVVLIDDGIQHAIDLGLTTPASLAS